MCQSTLAIYCFIDDLLKPLDHHNDIRAEVSDYERADYLLEKERINFLVQRKNNTRR